MSNPFNVGDEVVPSDSLAIKWPKALTKGKVYTVCELSKCRGYIRVPRDDNGRPAGFEWQSFTLYTGSQTTAYQGAMGAANRHGQRTSITAVSNKDYFKQLSEDMDDLDDGDGTSYDERKANASVLSRGRFKAGQVLVYCDGTPTATTLTVKRCTTTSVWFEETYSTPFNPDEFTLEYYDE